MLPPSPLGLLPAGPWRRRGLSPGPPRLRARHLRRRPPALGRPAQGGGGSRPRCPVGLARPLRGAGGPARLPPCPAPLRLTGPGPPSPALVGAPAYGLGGPPPLLRGNAAGGGKRAKVRPAFGGVAAPRRFPLWWGFVLFRAAPLPFGHKTNLAEKCRILPSAAASSKMVRKACPRGADYLQIGEKSGYIFHLARILVGQPEEKVKVVFSFAVGYCLGIRPPAQQNQDFVERGAKCRKASKSVEFSDGPDLITEVLDRSRRQ